MIAPNESIAGKSRIYQLKVVLRNSKPPVWRRLQVPGSANLGWLHVVLQVTMGWTNSHLHHFVVGARRYSDPRYNDEMAFGEERDQDESKAILAETLPYEGAEFEYEYDFGDSWEHVITIEKILPTASGASTTALCVAGKRACPPEDCGGPWGYQNLLEVIENPKHRDHKRLKEWLGNSFDPELFDLESTNCWLQKLKWPRVTEAQLRKVFGYE